MYSSGNRTAFSVLALDAFAMNRAYNKWHQRHNGTEVLWVLPAGAYSVFG